MTNLIQATFETPVFFADIQQDQQLLGISKLQAKVFNDFYGIKSIPVMQDESIETLIALSIQKVLVNARVVGKEISHVVYAHTSLTQSTFSYGILRRAVLKAGVTQAICFGINLNKCASAVEAISLIDIILQSSKENSYVLLVTGDFAFTMQQRFLQNASMAGDAAGAALFSSKKNDSYLKLLSTQKDVYPSFYKGAWIDKEKNKEFEEKFPEFMAEVIISSLRKSGEKIENVKYILPHNVNLPIWKKISDKLECDFNKIYTKNIEKFAHCFSTDFIINISSVADHLEDGDVVIGASVGFGLTFVSSVFKKMKSGG